MADKIVKSEYVSTRVPPAIAASIQRAALSRGMKVSAIACEILTNYIQSAKSPDN